MYDSQDKSKASLIRRGEIRELISDIDKLINSKTGSDEEVLAEKGDRLITLLQEEKFSHKILNSVHDQTREWPEVKKSIETELNSRLQRSAEEIEGNESELVDIDDPQVNSELLAASGAKGKEKESIMHELEIYLNEIIKNDKIEELTQKYALCKNCLAGIQNKDLVYEFNYNFKIAANTGMDRLPEIEKLQHMVTDINTILREKGEINKKDIRGILKENFGDKNGNIPPAMLFLLNIPFPKEGKAFRSEATKSEASSKSAPGTPLMKLKRTAERVSKRLSKAAADTSPSDSPKTKKLK